MANDESPKAADLPPYPDMILEAIEALDEKDGSTKSAISGYIEDKYEDLPPAHASLLTANLASMKESGKLVFAKNNYFRADTPSAPPKRGRGRPPKSKDPNAPTPVKGTISSPAPTKGTVSSPAPTKGTASTAKRGRGRPPKPKDPISEAVADAVAKATSGMPRSRGRPPKKAKVAPAPAPSSGSGAAAPAKRGRGRPPKVKA